MSTLGVLDVAAGIPTIRIFGPVRLQRIDTTRPLSENGVGKPEFLSTSPMDWLLQRPANSMTLRSAARTLLVLAVALPIVQAVLIWVRSLLASMGDDAGASIIGHVGTACQVVWTVSLVGLVIALALVVLNERPPQEPE